MIRSEILAFAAVGLVACDAFDGSILAQELPFTTTEIAGFDEPWAMAFLPDGRLLVTEKRGALRLFDPEGDMLDVSGVPEVSYGGQGGFGDVVVHPEFEQNRLVYLSYA